MANISDYETITELTYDSLLAISKEDKTYAISYENLVKCLTEGKLNIKQGSWNAGKILVVGADGSIRPIGELIVKGKLITENGEYWAIDDGANGYNKVTVSVPLLASLQISSNGHYEANDYECDAFSSVVVSVRNKTGTETISKNGIYSASSGGYDAYSQVTVSVFLSLCSISVSEQRSVSYYYPPYGYDGFSVIDVNVPTPVTGSKTVYSNGTYVASDDGYDAYSAVSVNIVDLSSIFKKTINGSYVNPEASYIEYRMFEAQYGLTYAAFQNCSNVLGRAFRSCTSLSAISIPNCMIVNEQAFMQCYELESISLPACITLGSYAFDDCTKLSAVYLGYSSMVRHVYLSSVVTAFLNTPIQDSSYLGYFGSIYVPESLIEEYRQASIWSNYSLRFAPF